MKMTNLNTVDYDKLTTAMRTRSTGPIAYLIYVMLGYPIAAMFSANVSMTLSATVWTSAWTYFWLAVGTLTAPLFILLGILAVIFIPIAIFLLVIGLWFLIAAGWNKAFPSKSRWTR